MNRSEQALFESLPWAPHVRLAACSTALGLWAVEKPSGFRAHPNRSGTIDSKSILAAPYCLKQECYKLPTSFESQSLYCINRLDQPTSGVMMFARTQKAARFFKQAIKERHVEKTYYALVKLESAYQAKTKKIFFWKDWLKKEHEGDKLRVGSGGSLLAETKIEWIGCKQTEYGPMGLLKLMPITGRTHQLRVQCAARGMPILGDGQYGDFAWNRRCLLKDKNKRLFLHAASWGWSGMFDNREEKFFVEIPLPSIFKEIFKAHK